jgi:hypothetical protein
MMTIYFKEWNWDLFGYIRTAAHACFYEHYTTQTNQFAKYIVSYNNTLPVPTQTAGANFTELTAN